MSKEIKKFCAILDTEKDLKHVIDLASCPFIYNNRNYVVELLDNLTLEDSGFLIPDETNATDINITYSRFLNDSGIPRNVEIEITLEKQIPPENWIVNWIVNNE